MFKLYTDGGARGNPGPAAIGGFIFDVKDSPIDFFGKYIGEETNNTAEYEALLHGLQVAKKQKIRKLTCYLDSQLVVNQLNGIYQVKHQNIKKMYVRVKELQKDFHEIYFIHVKREHNKFADQMVNVILDSIVNIT